MVKISFLGQSIGEYAVCLAVVLAVLLGMQIYVKRGLQGRYKGAVDYVAQQAPVPIPKQYEPYYVQDKYTVSQNKTGNEKFYSGNMKGSIDRNVIEDKTTVTGKSIRDVK